MLWSEVELNTKGRFYCSFKFLRGNGVFLCTKRYLSSFGVRFRSRASQNVNINSSGKCINFTVRLVCRYLSELLSDNSRISLHDVNDVLKAVYLNYENGLDVYFQFLNENLRELKEKYDDLKISDLILKPAKRIVTYKQLSKVRLI